MSDAERTPHLTGQQDFIDSNVFVYMLDDRDPGKCAVAERVIIEAIATGTGHISFQVVQETINVLTRKLLTPVTSVDMLRFLDEVLIPLWTVMPSRELFRLAFQIQSRYQTSFYDGIIVASALAAGCSRLLSEDLRHGQRIEGLTIENPFASGE